MSFDYQQGSHPNKFVGKEKSRRIKTTEKDFLSFSSNLLILLSLFLPLLSCYGSKQLL